MQYTKNRFLAVIIANCLVALLLAIALIYTSDEAYNFLIIGGWIAMMGASVLLNIFAYNKLYVVKKSRWIYWGIIFVNLIISLIITIKICVVLLGPEYAWSHKLIFLIGLLIFNLLGSYSQISFSVFCDQHINLKNRLVLKQLELDMLKVRMNPHYLFNALNNVAATIMVDKEMALDYTYKISEILRFLVGISNRETISIEEEIGFIQNYLDIEKLRLGTRCSITFTHTIPNNALQIPPLLVFPIVEGAIERSQGLDVKPSINANFEIRNNILRLEITNTVSQHPDNKGLYENLFDGIKQRLEFLYPKRHTFRFEEAAPIQMTQLEIRLEN
jgi:two-component system, LytTR family, sensor kinase